MVVLLLLQYFLPLDLITKEMFTQWMELNRQIVDRAVPEVSSFISDSTLSLRNLLSVD